MEKIINIKAKLLLQSLFSLPEIDTKCFQDYKPTKKEDKYFGKNKSAKSAFANAFSKKQ